MAVNTAETFIASGSLDATVRLWNIGPGSRVALKVANMAVEEVLYDLIFILIKM